MFHYRVVYKKQIRKSRARDVRRAYGGGAPWADTTGERSPRAKSASVWRGYYNAERYEPSAERSLRISRCKASKLENEERRENDQLADHEARLKCASVKKLHAKPYHRTRYDGCLTRVNV